MSTALVRVEDLRKVYRSRRRGDVVAVDGISFEVNANEVLGILGPNGAGKTTTIKSICTLVRPTAGTITVCGVDAVRAPARALENVTGVLEGNRNIFWRYTVRENLQFFSALQGIPPRERRAEIDGLIERFSLEDKRDTPVRMLSKGMQQKLSLACALIRSTPVLLLDEPTLGLDVEASHELRAHLKEIAATGERTIMLSSHDMAVVQDVCERVVILNNGTVVTDDRVENLLALFRARAYRFTVAGSLGDGAREALRARFPLVEVRDEGGDTSIEVELVDGSGFYDIIDVLRAAGATIESIDRQEPNLEEVFLEIIAGGKRR